MTLKSGARLGPYEILAPLGAGGMGEVYRARDTRLGREVALKVLTPEKLAETGHKQRFIEEARTASALNHPNIVTVYDIGSEEGLDFIAMELVRGKTLESLIPRKGLPLSDILKYAIPAVDALARAHAAGIVHRDVKPGNIMVTAEGLVKLLDFGLAKPSESDEVPDEHSATKTIRQLTEYGIVVGTAAYLSPEQAEGKKLDARSDIFSFGAVLFEMATGHRAFQGTSKLSIVSAVLLRDPLPPAGRIAGVPLELTRIIARCLRKDPNRRYLHAADLKIALEDLRDEMDSGTPASADVAAAPPRRWRGLLLIAVVLALGWLASVWWLRRPQAAPLPAALTQVTFDSGLTTDPALSPDGKFLAYASDRGGTNLNIWVQQVGGGDPIQLTHDTADNWEPSFSPGGTRIIFRSEADAGGIYTVPTLGGQIRKLADEGRQPRFSPDGNWIAYRIGHPDWVSGGSKLYVMPAAGGPARQIQPAFAGAGDAIWAPDARHLLFVGSRALGPQQQRSNVDWWTTGLDEQPAVPSGAVQFLQRFELRSRIPLAWDPDGQHIILSAGTDSSTDLWRMPISRTWKITGAPERLTLGTALNGPASVSAGSLLAFASLSRKSDVWTLPLNSLQGRIRGDLERVTRDGTAVDPSLSTSGGKIVFVSMRSGNPDVWLRDLRTGRDVQVTATPFPESIPVLSADGSRIAYRAIEGPKNNIDNIYSVDVSVEGRPGVPQRLCEDCGAPMSWSPDNRQLLCLTGSPVRVFLLDTASGRSTTLVQHASRNAFEPQFSHDGRWLLFLLHGPGRSRVYAAPFTGQPLDERQWIPLTDGLSWEDKPRWSPDDRLIYFTSDRDGARCIWAQRLDADKHPEGPPFPVFHSHNARLALQNVRAGWLEIAVAGDRMVFNMGELTGNLWMTRLPGRP